MKCDDHLSGLGDYVDGEEGTPAGRRFAAHLAECGPCRGVVDNIFQTLALYKAGPVAGPADLHERLSAALFRQWQAKFNRPRQARGPRSRQIVLEELCNVTSHPCAAELHELARCRLPTISLRTVRRNLDILLQMGLVQKLELMGFEPRFDGNAEPHDHLCCRQCGRVADLDRAGPELSRWGRQTLCGDDLTHRGRQLQGTCPCCADETLTARQ